MDNVVDFQKVQLASGAENVAQSDDSSPEKTPKERGEDFVNNALTAIVEDRKTTHLTSVLSKASDVFSFSVNDDSLKDKSKSELTDIFTRKLIGAAKTTRFDVEVVEQLSVLKFKFDGEIEYSASFDSVGRHDLNRFAVSIDQENADNRLIERANSQAMGFNGGDPLTWLKEPLNTHELSALLRCADHVQEGLLDKSTAKYKPVSAHVVTELARGTLYNIALDVRLNQIHLSFNDKKNTQYTVHLPSYLNTYSMDEIFASLRQEQEANFKYVRENDPGREALMERMKSASAYLNETMSDDLKEYLDSVLKKEPENTPAPDNVSPMRRR